MLVLIRPRGGHIDSNEAGLHGTSLPVRCRLALCADPRPLEAVGVSTDPGVPGAAADACVGAGGSLSLDLRGAFVVVANVSPHGADGVGVHHGASAFAPVRLLLSGEGSSNNDRLIDR